MASVFGMWAESILPFVEVDPACSKLVVGREMCLRELTVRKLPESFLAGRHVKPGHCGLCSRSQSEQEPPARPACEPDLRVWAFSMCCCLWHLTRRPHACVRAQGFPRFRAAWHTLLSRGPFPTSWSSCGLLDGLWTVCIQQAVTSPHSELPISQTPLGLAPGSGPKRSQLSGSYWKNPLCPVEQEVQ